MNETEKRSKAQTAVSGKKSYLDRSVLQKEIDLGRQYLGKGDPELARLFFKNAAALQSLTDSRDDAPYSAQLAGFIKMCEKPRLSVKRTCHNCGGTGKMRMKITSLKGEVSYQNVYGKFCPECDGRGCVLTSGTVDDWKYRKGTALREYGTIQQSRRYIPQGDAWIPADFVDVLSVRQAVSLRRAVAPPCPACMGIGRMDCRKCNGTGGLKCPNRECVNGMVEVESGGQLTKTTIMRTEKCETCHGTGFVSCGECNGGGSVLCSKCNGLGERAACRKCSGEGLIRCRRCGGTGQYRGALCQSCRGDRIAVCPSCNGDGRRR